MFRSLNKKPDTSYPVNTSYPLMIEGFSERETISLFQAGKLRRFADGECVVQQGNHLVGLILVLEGSLSMAIGNDAHDAIVSKVNIGGWIGNADLSGNRENGFSIYSSGSSKVLEIDPFAFTLFSTEIQIAVYRKIAHTSLGLIANLASRSKALKKQLSSLVTYSQTSHEHGKNQYANYAWVQEMIKTFPRLPIQINKLTSMLLDEGASVSEIVSFAKMDPSIVSVVLKMVNSGYYNFQRKISDFHHAFVLLGFNQVYQILMDNFLQGIMPKHFNLKELNLHSAIISQIAFDIASLTKKTKPVMMSTLGILHDLGKCVVLIANEKKPEMGFDMTTLDDSKIGSLLLDSWNTPAVICQSVEHQPFPQFCPPERIPEGVRDNVSILYIAHLCFNYLCGRSEEDIEGAFFEDYMNILDMKNSSIQDLVNQHIMPSLIKKIDVFPDYVREFIQNNQPSA